MQIDLVSVTIGAGATVSSAYDLGIHSINVLQPKGLTPYVATVGLPAAWTSAALGYQTSPDGSTWSDLVNLRGPIVAVGTVANQTLQSGADPWRGARFVRVTSSPAQAAARVVTLGIGACAGDPALFIYR